MDTLVVIYLNLEIFKALDATFYGKGKNIAESTEEIKSVSEKKLLGEITWCKWFSNFKDRNFDLNNLPRSGRPKGHKY